MTTIGKETNANNSNTNENDTTAESEGRQHEVNFQLESLPTEESKNVEDATQLTSPHEAHSDGNENTNSTMSLSMPDDSFNGSTLIMNPGTGAPTLGLSQSLSNQEEVDPIAGSLPTVVSTGFSNEASIATAVGETENDISQETIRGNNDEKNNNDQLQMNGKETNQNQGTNEVLIKVEKDPSPTPPLQHSFVLPEKKNDIQIVSTTYPTTGNKDKLAILIDELKNGSAEEKKEEIKDPKSEHQQMGLVPKSNQQNQEQFKPNNPNLVNPQIYSNSNSNNSNSNNNSLYYPNNRILTNPHVPHSNSNSTYSSPFMYSTAPQGNGPPPLPTLSNPNSVNNNNNNKGISLPNPPSLNHNNSHQQQLHQQQHLQVNSKSNSVPNSRNSSPYMGYNNHPPPFNPPNLPSMNISAVAQQGQQKQPLSQPQPQQQPQPQMPPMFNKAMSNNYYLNNTMPIPAAIGVGGTGKPGGGQGNSPLHVGMPGPGGPNSLNNRNNGNNNDQNNYPSLGPKGVNGKPTGYGGMYHHHKPGNLGNTSVPQMSHGPSYLNPNLHGGPSYYSTSNFKSMYKYNNNPYLAGRNNHNNNNSVLPSNAIAQAASSNPSGGGGQVFANGTITRAGNNSNNNNSTGGGGNDNSNGGFTSGSTDHGSNSNSQNSTPIPLYANSNMNVTPQPYMMNHGGYSNPQPMNPLGMTMGNSNAKSNTSSANNSLSNSGSSNTGGKKKNSTSTRSKKGGNAKSSGETTKPIIISTGFNPLTTTVSNPNPSTSNAVTTAPRTSNKSLADDDSEIKWHCDQPGCTFKTKHKGSIKRHQVEVHNIGDNIKWYVCNQGDCKYKTKSKCDFKKHQRNVHQVGENIQFYYCDQPGCAYKASVKGSVKIHLRLVHNVGENITWYHCNQPGCNYKAKYKPNLKEHQKRRHNIYYPNPNKVNAVCEIIESGQEKDDTTDTSNTRPKKSRKLAKNSTASNSPNNGPRTPLSHITSDPFTESGTPGSGSTFPTTYGAVATLYNSSSLSNPSSPVPSITPLETTDI